METNNNIQPSSKTGNCFSKKAIHMWWTISIMTFAVIALIGFIYKKQTLNGETMMSYISFASTLLSIVLSVFAIIYSYFSALEASRQWSDINKAVSVILKATENIENNNSLLLQTVITIKGDVKAMGYNSYDNTQKGQDDLDDININNRGGEKEKQESDEGEARS